MRNNWKKHQLFDLYDVRSGMGNKSRKDFHPTKYENKMIMFKDVFYNSKLPNKLETTVNLIGTELERFNVLKDDVFLTSSSETSNELAMSSVAMKDYNNTVFTGFTKRLRPKTDLTYIGFMRYWFRSFEFRRVIDSSVSMTTRANLNNSILSNVTITLPSINEQKAIANILSSFDDKIEVNNKINENLENLAQVLYKHWFVDFEFPDENGNPYKSSGGKMIESELGPIPYGWEVKEQGEYFPIITGKKNANYSTDDGEFNFFTCSQQIFKAPGYSFEGSAILVAGNGDFNVKYYKGKFEAYQRTYVLIPHNEKLSGLLYFLIKENLSEITSGHRGSVIKFITKGDLEKYKIIMPKDIQLLEQMSRQFQNIVNKIQHNNEENTKLAEMRDLLLPKLMSGEIRMPVEE